MDTTLTKRAEALCRAVAPHDLANRNLYILDGNGLPEELTARYRCRGVTGLAFDLLFREQIGEAWQGPGAAIVLHFEDIAANVHPAAVEAAINETLLHELAHVLREEFYFRPRVAVESVAKLTERSAAYLESATDDDLANPDAHDSQFVRCQLHLMDRARRLGADVYFGDARPPGFGFRAWPKLVASLAEEFDAMADYPFCLLLAAPMPKRYVALWEHNERLLAASQAEWAATMNKLAERRRESQESP